jgi:hypothetical protein
MPVEFLTDDEAVIWTLIVDRGVDLRVCVADSVSHGAFRGVLVSNLVTW